MSSTKSSTKRSAIGSTPGTSPRDNWTSNSVATATARNPGASGKTMKLCIANVGFRMTAPHAHHAAGAESVTRQLSRHVSIAPSAVSRIRTTRAPV